MPLSLTRTALHSASRIGLLLGVEKRSHTIQYRPDIDGLRAVAVLLVVFYHLGFSAIPGGFIGVDVFFVISGYLITGIIVHELDAGKFSILRFYARRVRRLAPALFLVTAVTLLFGIVFLLPGDFIALAESAIASTFAFSNIYFMRNTGYFDIQADALPMLHTWSLGVEEQFYLVWPALLALLSLIGKRWRNILAGVLLILVVSFAIGYYTTLTSPKVAFYSPIGRAWEFCVGGLLSLVTHRRAQSSRAAAEASPIIGLLILGASAVLMTKQTLFPGAAALLPVIGAALLIVPFEHRSLVHRALSTKPMIFIGAISYSLYLWHWPIITLYRHYDLGRPLDTAPALALLALMIVLAWASWRYVEKPFRGGTGAIWPTFAKGGAAAVVLSAAALLVIHSGGFPSRLPEESQRYRSLKEMSAWDCPQKRDMPEFGPALRTVCVLGAPYETARYRAILLGDSHAEHFEPILEMAARDANVAIVRPTRSCMPLVGLTQTKRYAPDLPGYSEGCAEYHALMAAYVKASSDIKVVILASAWSAYLTQLYRGSPSDAGPLIGGLRSLEAALPELSSSFAIGDNRGLLLISDVSRRSFVNADCLTRGSLLWRAPCPREFSATPINTSQRIFQAETDAAILEYGKRATNVVSISPQSVMCGATTCATSENGEFLYRDVMHLRMNLLDETRVALARRIKLKEALESVAPAGLESQPR